GASLHLVELDLIPGAARERRQDEHRCQYRPTHSPSARRGRRWQREHEQRATERGVLRELLVAADRAETFRGFGETRRHADAGPATDAGVHADVLLAVVLIGEDVADDSRGRLELPEFLAVLGAHGFQITFQRAVEGDVAGSRQGTGPHGESFGL